MVASAATTQYYLRVDGKIRGPFELERLRSMRQRNRLGPRDELSVDRRTWMPAGTVTAVFPEGFAGVERDAEAADWHYMRAGQQQGPVTLMTLQMLAQSGELAPQDSVWRLGTSGWVLASQVPELSFPPSRSWWYSLHAVTRVGIVAAGVLLFIAPIWLVLGYYQQQATLVREQSRIRNEDEKWRIEQEVAEKRWQIEQNDKWKMHRDKVDSEARAKPRYPINSQVGTGKHYISLGLYWRGEVRTYHDGNYGVKIFESNNKSYRAGETYSFGEHELEAK